MKTGIAIVACMHCGGRGEINRVGFGPMRCARCNGTGQVTVQATVIKPTQGKAATQ